VPSLNLLEMNRDKQMWGASQTSFPPYTSLGGLVFGGGLVLEIILKTSLLLGKHSYHLSCALSPLVLVFSDRVLCGLVSDCDFPTFTS
jgi:hypothetical protein